MEQDRQRLDVQVQKLQAEVAAAEKKSSSELSAAAKAKEALEAKHAEAIGSLQSQVGLSADMSTCELGGEDLSVLEGDAKDGGSPEVQQLRK